MTDNTRNARATAAIAATLLLLPIPALAQVVQISVDSTADTNRYATIDPLPSLCTAAPEDCTLREAIATANALCWAAPGGADPTGRRAVVTIDVPGAPTPTITLTNTFLPPVLCNFALDGRGATISGNGTERLFLVGDDGTVLGGRRILVTLANLTLSSARALGGSGGSGRFAGGGGAGLGAALFVNSHADVVLDSVRATGNSAAGGAGGSGNADGGTGGGGGMRGNGGVGAGNGGPIGGGGGGGGLGGPGGPGGPTVGGSIGIGGGGGLGAFAFGGGSTGRGGGGGLSGPQWWPGLDGRGGGFGSSTGGTFCGGGASDGGVPQPGRGFGAGATSTTILTNLAGGGGC